MARRGSVDVDVGSLLSAVNAAQDRVQERLGGAAAARAKQLEPEPEPEPEPRKKKKGGALGRARRASVTLAGMMGKGKDAKELDEASDSSEEDEGGPSHVVRAGDDEANIAHLLHTLEPKEKSPEQVKKKVGRVRRMSVNLAEAMAAKADDAAPPEEDEEDDYDPAPGATTPSGAGSQDGSPEQQPKKKKGFVGRMRRMSVDAVQKVATAVAGQELVDEAAAAAEEGKAPPRRPRCVATVDEFVVPVSRLGTLRPCGRAKVPATRRGPRPCRTWSGRTGAPPESRRR